MFLWFCLLWGDVSARAGRNLRRSLPLLQTGYLPVGPQINVPLSTVTSGGWVQCFSAEYKHVSSVTDLVNCNAISTTAPLMMACSNSTSSDHIALLAWADRSLVLNQTGANLYTVTPGNGADWYYQPLYSWGFAPHGDGVEKNQCDTLQYPDNEKRLCWHTKANVGGYRCGSHSLLNKDTVWLKQIFIQVPCTPLSCAAAGATCGTPSNGCGGTLNCGTCPSPQTCGGGGTLYQCGCTPTTCSALGLTCGTTDDGCGNPLNCGTCSGSDTCGGGGVPGVCGSGCVLTTCLALGATCGSFPDGCSGTLNCGSCSGFNTCGGGGQPNQCGCTPTTCSALSATCGSYDDGCGGTLDCGSCSGSQTCGGGSQPRQCGGGCTPTTCGQLGATCGSYSDGCTGTLSCGNCSGFNSCGGGSQPKQCGCTASTCASLLATCGTPPDGCGNTLASCGTCGTTSRCAGSGTPFTCEKVSTTVSAVTPANPLLNITVTSSSTTKIKVKVTGYGGVVVSSGSVQFVLLSPGKRQPYGVAVSSSDGTATWTSPKLTKSVGTYTVTAAYQANGPFAASTNTLSYTIIAV